MVDALITLHESNDDIEIHTILELAVYSRRFVVKSPKNVTANSSLLWNIR